MPDRVLFVCRANIARSITGQIVFIKKLITEGKKVLGINGDEINSDFIVESRGTEGNDYRTQQMTREIGERAKIVYALDGIVERTLIDKFAVPPEKIINLNIPEDYTHPFEKNLERLLEFKLSVKY